MTCRPLSRSHDGKGGTGDLLPGRLVLPSLLVPALLYPVPAYAVQVGCFFTAVFLGIMFIVCIGLTSVTKHLLARHLWKIPRTPWLRMFGITWLELLLGILAFVVVRANFWITVAAYLPFAALMNRKLLSRFRQGDAGPSPFFDRYGIFLLLSLALPVSLQVSGLLWSTLTGAITFTEIR